MAGRCNNFGNKGGRWGYGGNNFRGRENSGPRTHSRFSAGGNNSAGGNRPNYKANGYGNNNSGSYRDF